MGLHLGRWYGFSPVPGEEVGCVVVLSLAAWRAAGPCVIRHSHCAQRTIGAGCHEIVASGNERFPDALGRSRVTLPDTVECDRGVAVPMTAGFEGQGLRVAKVCRPAGLEERGQVRYAACLAENDIQAGLGVSVQLRLVLPATGSTSRRLDEVAENDAPAEPANMHSGDTVGRKARGTKPGQKTRDDAVVQALP